jgi:hypothetical protein
LAILKDERSGITLTLSGYDELLKRLDDTNKTKMSETLLLAAEPIIKAALDAEMTRHPGPLQQSLRSTGARRNSAGQWYLAYRATNGNERESDNRRNTEKMVFLINREYIRRRVTRDGRQIKEYAIPADDVIEKAVKRCEAAVTNAMQEAFNRALDEIW